MAEHEWISVKEQTPLMHADCWISQREVVRKGSLRWDGQWVDEQGNVINGVTHWMLDYKPDPPEVSDG